MQVRRIVLEDRAALLTSFKPLFKNWDYLPLVIDDWLQPSSRFHTWVACAGPAETMLVAMAQVVELEAGDWYLRGLRSNPQASPQQNAWAVLALSRVLRSELRHRKVDTIRYGTLSDYRESLRLARLFGFREHFRLGHAQHQLPAIREPFDGVELVHPDNPPELLDYLGRSAGLRPVHGYFLTWWDTRKLRVEHLVEAGRQGLLLAAKANKRMVGVGMFWHVPWQGHLVFSVMEGTDEALEALYRAGVVAAHERGCRSIGLVHPSLNELNRRQALFGLETSGCDTVQLISCSATAGGLLNEDNRRSSAETAPDKTAIRGMKNSEG
jgi:hypothetical protein